MATSEIVGAKRGQDAETVFVFAKKKLFKIKLPNQVLWESDLPPQHELIAFDVGDEFLVIATNSDQGFRDGELLRRFLTTQAFSISPNGQ